MRLSKVNGLKPLMRMEASSAVAGPICPVCGNHRFVLLDNTCGHTACEKCWTLWCEQHLEYCQSNRALVVRCIDKTCTAAVAPPLWAAVGAQSAQVQKFQDYVTTELQRLQRYVATTRLA